METGSGKITGLWLVSGKKLTVVGKCAMVGTNFLVRSGPRHVLVVPGDKVVSVETEYASEAEVDEVFK